MRESVLQSKILQYCKDKQIYAVNVHGSALSSKGTPDILICCKGRFIAVETKVGKNKVSPAQEIHHKRVLRSGGSVIVPYTFDEFLITFEELIR